MSQPIRRPQTPTKGNHMSRNGQRPSLLNKTRQFRQVRSLMINDVNNVHTIRLHRNNGKGTFSKIVNESFQTSNHRQGLKVLNGSEDDHFLTHPARMAGTTQLIPLAPSSSDHEQKVPVVLDIPDKDGGSIPIRTRQLHQHSIPTI
ncbi:unnamed protein product [Citrullus colocynthis]|uniref:Uncharacterized protein n=1 Tax=Citrullus colocynthis TaxID=252529 RepID=A0ABP0YBF6_9ROSI